FEQNIRRFRETEMVLQQVVNSLTKDLLTFKSNGIHLSKEIIKRLHPQKLLLFELLKPYGFTENVLDDLIIGLHKQSGTIYSSNTHHAIVDRVDVIIVEIQNNADQALCFIHNANEEVKFLNQHLSISYSDVVQFEKEPTKAFVDARNLIYPLILRTRQEGDKFIPLGMKTFKKLSNFFVDQKVPINQKEVVPVLVNGNGDIIWIAGHRQDDRFKITGSTSSVVVFELIKG
ncbi:MAG: tRNA(Ile)-lysidine synthetase, partial [Pedobacter sp.]